MNPGSKNQPIVEKLAPGTAHEYKQLTIKEVCLGASRHTQIDSMYTFGVKSTHNRVFVSSAIRTVRAALFLYPDNRIMTPEPCDPRRITRAFVRLWSA